MHVVPFPWCAHKNELSLEQVESIDSRNGSQVGKSKRVSCCYTGQGVSADQLLCPPPPSGTVRGISLILLESCFGSMGSTFQNLCHGGIFCLFVCFKAKENWRGWVVEIMHGKHFLYFSAKMCMEQDKKYLSEERYIANMHF